jgi:16S rRNA A1518/A1519 N6-dimethyltransferase RsmA/KsgA/DIM1 with predicted DNA glycosylase/AP lyase activity
MIRDPEGIESAAIASIHALHGAHLLEIGCGDGRLTRQFAELAARVTAIELDAALVATAEAYPNVRYAAASALDLPFPSEQFNTALLAWSL